MGTELYKSNEAQIDQKLTLFDLGFLRVAGPGGGGKKVPASHNSKTINANEMKFGGVVENHKLINLVSCNWRMTS